MNVDVAAGLTEPAGMILSACFGLPKSRLGSNIWHDLEPSQSRYAGIGQIDGDPVPFCLFQGGVPEAEK